MNLSECKQWRIDQLRRSRFSVESIRECELRSWSWQDGRLVHDTSGFFSITGLEYSGTDPSGGLVRQPFIDQPEVGILGFLSSSFGDEVHLLVQAKTEPGNPGGTQFAPTFQCTESNYRLRHGGERAPFFEFFSNRPEGLVHVDSLQSEQGTRFLGKYNRNVVVELPADSAPQLSDGHGAWRWLPFSIVRELLLSDLQFNTDARSVLAVSDWQAFCIDSTPFGRWAHTSGLGFQLWASYHHAPSDERIGQVLAWLEACRRSFAQHPRVVPLDELSDWSIDEDGVASTTGENVAVRYYKVHAYDREVPQWTQPLFTSATEGQVIQVLQVRDGLLRWRLRASREPGFTNKTQLSSTFQIFPGHTNSDDSWYSIFEDSQWVHDQASVVFDCMMSEEGGRFFRDINRYRVVMAPEDATANEDPLAIWLTLAEITALKSIPGVFTNEFRSLLSLFLRFL